MRELRPTEADGRRALRDHVAACAAKARERYGELRDEEDLRRFLADSEVVRFPTELVFDAEGLLPGEFGHAAPRSERMADGYRLVIHPSFRSRPQLVPLLAAYHVPTINYGDIATFEEAELFGATLFAMEIEEYYHLLCGASDELIETASSGSEGTP